MKYYAMIDGEQRGPYELEQLPEAGVRPSTYVWCKGMTDWEKAEDVADVCRLFRNRIYDLMHPTLASSPATQVSNDSSDIINDGDNPYPTRFDRYLKDQPQPHLPTLEEIDSRRNLDIPPSYPVGLAWFVTIFFFPPTGIAALYYSYKSKSAWKHGEAKAAHDYCRSARMMTGISLFLGLIVWAFLFTL